MEFHGMSWTLYYFHDISEELCGIQMECHGIPWNAIDVILFPWHFSGIIWHPGGISMHFSEIPWNFSGMPWNSMGY